MAQFARPSADTLIGDWTDESGGTTDIYSGIDEVTAEDTGLIRSELAPSSSVYVTKLSSVIHPGVTTGHVLRYRYRKNAASGATIDLTVQLRQNYVNEGNLGTLIAEEIHTDISESFTDGSVTLSGAEAGNISNYSNLYLRFIADQS